MGFNHDVLKLDADLEFIVTNGKAFKVEEREHHGDFRIFLTITNFEHVRVG